MNKPVLSVENLVAGYEPDLPIVRGASLYANAGEIVVILGPNGAGKSTLIKAVAGLVLKSSGRVTLGDRDITNVPAHSLVGLGLAFVPQTENVFPRMSVQDNLRVAGGILRPREVPQRINQMYEMFPDLLRQKRDLAGSLSGGQRQML
ncbi:MAG: ATP-binding cassette domain-containing protein, partial [Fimbriimonadaceae bacterium]